MNVTNISTLLSNNALNNNASNNATIIINNSNNNTANWLGFNKLVANETLMDLLSGYIGYIVALTVYNLILLYQQRKR